VRLWTATGDHRRPVAEKTQAIARCRSWEIPLIGFFQHHHIEANKKDLVMK
jgi:hypothetical protein